MDTYDDDDYWPERCTGRYGCNCSACVADREEDAAVARAMERDAFRDQRSFEKELNEAFGGGE